MKDCCISILFALFSFAVSAQTLSPRVTPVAGGYAAGGNATLSFTIGETFAPILTSGTNLLSQGQQQPEIDLLCGEVHGGLCAGGQLEVFFSAAGYVDAANVFTLELSDGNGSFAAPLALGTINGTAGGSIAGAIPNGSYPPGADYRVRIVSSHPVFTGTEQPVSACVITFSGAVLWEHDGASGVQNATVNLGGAGTGIDLTDLNGDYTMSLSGTTGNFTIKPVKNLNRLNGVTVGDALAIQQHLTNINPITNPWKMIAADVNRSNSVTTIDATLIKQCILGNPAANNIFNVFWRFAPQSWTPALPPWGFPEQIDLTGVSTNQSGLDFYGVKIGDVIDGDADPANFGAGAPLVLRVQDRVLRAGEPLTAEFRADQLDDLAALQFALTFDPAALQFDSVDILDGLPLTMDNFGFFNIAEGEIRVVWGQEKGVMLGEAAGLFRLRFTALEGGALLREALGLNDPESSGLPGRAYNSILAESGVELRFGEATGVAYPGAGRVLLLQNRPNPFSSETIIEFVLPSACDVQLRVFDQSGRLLREHSAYYAAGRSAAAFNFNEGEASGLLYYELTTPYGMLTKRMVLVGN